MSDEQLRGVLDRYFSQKVQLKQSDKENALSVWQPIVKAILQKVKEKDSRFDFSLLYSGSYYERTKVKTANEFDIMVEIESLKLDQTYDGGEDSLARDPPPGFTTVMIDQGEERIWMPGGHIGNGNLLSSTAIKSTFARLVHESVRDLNLSARGIGVTTSGPAVTLCIHQESFRGSIDLALAIEDVSWPDDAEDWKQRRRNGWPSQSLVKKIVQGGCHLVAKKPKGPVNRQEVDYLWRYSFSRAEKKLFTEGSRGDAGTCRRTLLRILKCLREDLQLTPLSTFHLKTIVLYEYEAFPSDTDWGTHQIPARFKSALHRLLRCLQQKQCPHYFIQDVNLFEGNSFNDQRYQYLRERIDQLLRDPCNVIQSLIC